MQIRNQQLAEALRKEAADLRRYGEERAPELMEEAAERLWYYHFAKDTPVDHDREIPRAKRG